MSSDTDVAVFAMILMAGLHTPGRGGLSRAGVFALVVAGVVVGVILKSGIDRQRRRAS